MNDIQMIKDSTKQDFRNKVINWKAVLSTMVLYTFALAVVYGFVVVYMIIL